MATISDSFGPELRIPVEARWMPGDHAECVIHGDSITLRDAKLGSEVRLTCLHFKRRSGLTLSFISKAGQKNTRWIEFAGMGSNAQFDVTCFDLETAMKVEALIKNLLEGAYEAR